MSSLFAVQVIAALPERWKARLEILVRARRQAALAGTAVVLAKMRKVAFARITRDRATDRRLARGQSRGKEPGIAPNDFPHCYLRTSRSIYAVRTDDGWYFRDFRYREPGQPGMLTNQASHHESLGGISDAWLSITRRAW